LDHSIRLKSLLTCCLMCWELQLHLAAFGLRGTLTMSAPHFLPHLRRPSNGTWFCS
jgi:hypothetical protein